MEAKPEAGKDSADEIIEVRRQKRVDWAAKGIKSYPTAAGTQPSTIAAKLHSEFDSKTKEELEALVKDGKIGKYSVAGRIMLHRSFGKATFLTIHDRSGKIQLYAQSSKLDAVTYDLVKHLDLGDIVYGEGSLFKTKTGELTIDCDRLKLLSKNTRPLPEKFHGLQDIEVRYRQRYLDLISNEDSRKVFDTRSKVVREIRKFFYERDYLEVETPMLHPLVGGAAARPFKTHHNTLDMPLFLRIAPELYLKRLVVGGLERVFEINRCFRNEGISIKHNPEFTMLEFYEAYATYEDLMRMTEKLLEELAVKVLGTTEIDYQGMKISLKAPFRRLTVAEALKEVGKIDPTNQDLILNALKKKGIQIKGKPGLPELQWLYFEEFIESELIQPTYVMDHPVEVSPLARRSEEKPGVAERFELYIGGREIANGFNELNDPDDQASRFHDQLKRKQAGDEEAADFDEDYIQALQVGLPPTAGEGIGIDRLVMLLTNSPSIRDVILFPQMRPLHSQENA